MMRPLLCGAYLTCVGKVAPPIPTIPFSARSCLISSGGSTRPLSRGVIVGSSVSWPSFLMTIQAATVPLGRKRLSLPTTTPLTLAWILLLTAPWASAIFCPRYTFSPGCTNGLAGAPICIESGSTTFSGAGIASIGSSAVKFLAASIWVPPIKVCRRENMLSPR